MVIKVMGLDHIYGPGIFLLSSLERLWCPPRAHLVVTWSSLPGDTAGKWSFISNVRVRKIFVYTTQVLLWLTRR